MFTQLHHFKGGVCGTVVCIHNSRVKCFHERARYKIYKLASNSTVCIHRVYIYIYTYILYLYQLARASLTHALWNWKYRLRDSSRCGEFESIHFHTHHTQCSPPRVYSCRHKPKAKTNLLFEKLTTFGICYWICVC